MNIINNRTKIILLPLIIKAGLFLLGYLYITTSGFYQNKTFNLSLLDYFHQNDSSWYEFIFENGINIEPNSMVEGWRVPNQHTAFFPLYPYFIKSLTFIFGGDFKIWGNVISLISVSLLSLLSFDFLKTYLNNEKVAFNSTILLISNPFSLHFYTLYTESLFLVLFIGCLICIQRNKWLLLIFLSIPLTLIRPNGIFTALIMGVFILEKK